MKQEIKKIKNNSEQTGKPYTRRATRTRLKRKKMHGKVLPHTSTEVCAEFVFDGRKRMGGGGLQGRETSDGSDDFSEEHFGPDN